MPHPLPVLAAAALFSFAPAIAAHAQAQAPAAATVSAEKKALIEELLVLTKVRENAAATVKGILAQSESAINQMVPQMIAADPDLTAEQRQAALKTAPEAGLRAYRRFSERMIKQIDFAGVTADVSAELFGRFYTADELRDLIAFYRTPTGQKAANLTPQLASESVRLSNERLIPQISAIVRQVMLEEQQAVRKQAAAAKPGKAAAGKPAKARGKSR